MTTTNLVNFYIACVGQKSRAIPNLPFVRAVRFKLSKIGNLLDGWHTLSQIKGNVYEISYVDSNGVVIDDMYGVINVSPDDFKTLSPMGLPQKSELKFYGKVYINRDLDLLRSLMHWFIDQSPCKMIVVLFRDSPTNKDLIQGALTTDLFLSKLAQQEILFNVAYIISDKNMETI
jgi:hypothetical protein